jgi:regulator of sirC expression with transglutaminase-like and TPR domain
MIHQRDAVLRLLRDEDPSTLALVKSQLVQKGADDLEALRLLLASADRVAAVHLREVVSEIEKRDADRVFADTCASFEDHGDLESAAWRLAATFMPGEDFSTARNLLDEWGVEVTHRLRKAVTAHDRIETLVEFLGQDLHLRGNEDDYNNINNSLLPEVIETRLGVPITLSLVYILVGKRAGLTVHGVGLPGHFIIRHGENFFDPFHGGQRIGLEACRAIVSHCGLALSSQHLLPVTPRQMLARILQNIHSLAEPSDEALAEKVAGWIAILRTHPQATPK